MGAAKLGYLSPNRNRRSNPVQLRIMTVLVGRDIGILKTIPVASRGVSWDLLHNLYDQRHPSRDFADFADGVSVTVTQLW